MWKTTMIFFLFLILASCNEKEIKRSKLSLDDCPVIAYQENLITVLDMALVKDTFNFPLSGLLSTFEIIPLDNSTDALIGSENMAYAISENYLGFYTYPSGYKLFNRKGKYLRAISSRGQGPDEHAFGIYDSYIDEELGKVYLLTYMADKLLVFSLEGEPLEHIPFPFRVHKGRFCIDEEKEELLVMALPFIDTPSVIWKQDFKGNIFQEIDSTPFIIEPGDYANDVNEFQNTTNIDFSLFHWVPTADTLYHYQEERNALSPVFTVKWKNGEPERHSYTELPNYYLMTLVTHSAAPGYSPTYPIILLDKKTLRGCYVNLKMNMLGNIDGPSYFYLNRGYCFGNIPPYTLKDQLEKALLHPEKISAEMQDKLKRLNRSLSEEDNNILLVGKLRGNE